MEPGHDRTATDSRRSWAALSGSGSWRLLLALAAVWTLAAAISAWLGWSAASTVTRCTARAADRLEAMAALDLAVTQLDAELASSSESELSPGLRLQLGALARALRREGFTSLPGGLAVTLSNSAEAATRLSPLKTREAVRALLSDLFLLSKSLVQASHADLDEATARARRLRTVLPLLWLVLVLGTAALVVRRARAAAASFALLEDGLRRIAAGDFTVRLPVGGEHAALGERINTLAAALRVWTDDVMAISARHETKIRQITEVLEATAAGRVTPVPTEEGDALTDPLTRAAAAMLRAGRTVSADLSAAEKQLQILRWNLEEDCQSLAAWLGQPLGVDARPPALSAASPLAPLLEELRALRERLGATMDEVGESAAALHGSSQEILERSQAQEREFKDEYQVIHETAASVNEVSVAARQSAQMVDAVFRSSQEAMETAEQGYRIIQQVMDGMSSITSQVDDIAREILGLSEKSQEIGTIVQTISDISKQTNLLALNAAIEAAGAGEHGRGFAVVAKEIRELASSSATATREIEQLIGQVQRATNSAVMATEQGSKRVEGGVQMVATLRESFQRIVEKFQEVVESAHQISMAAQEQTVGARQVAAAIGDIDRMMKQSLESVGRFRQLVSQYKDRTDRLRSFSGRR